MLIEFRTSVFPRRLPDKPTVVELAVWQDISVFPSPLKSPATGRLHELLLHTEKSENADDPFERPTFVCNVPWL
jgi:hypothetical protein